MREWRSATVSELEADGVLLVQDGNHGNDRPLAHEFVIDGTPFIRAADMADGRVLFDRASQIDATALARIRKGHGRAGDSVLSHKGTVGKVAFVPTDTAPFVCSPQTTFWRSLDPSIIDARFLNYVLRSPLFVAQLDSQKGETDMAPYVSLTQQRQLRISFPSLSEQQAIAEVLGALDDKIAANTALAVTAEETISTSYQSAIRGGANDKPLLEELVVEFGEPFGGAFFVGAGTGRPLIRIRDLKTFDSQVWTTEVRQKEVRVNAGDILVGMDAEFRATPWLGERGLLNQRVMRASHVRHGRALVREVLKRPLAEAEAEKSATTVIHLNKSDLARKRVLIPSDLVALSRFEAIAEPLFESRINLSAENRTLAAIRDALLPQLMSGKLRVRDAERLAEEAGA